MKMARVDKVASLSVSYSAERGWVWTRRAGGGDGARGIRAAAARNSDTSFCSYCLHGLLR